MEAASEWGFTDLSRGQGGAPRALGSVEEAAHTQLRVWGFCWSPRGGVFGAWPKGALCSLECGLA